MGYEFDINEFKTPGKVSDQYQKQLKRLTDQGKSVEQIEAAVQGALKNLSAGKKRFVIYGEPQSGKTEMMICLTAKLLDDGHRFIVHLLNDSVDLLDQNLGRFHGSGLAPAAQNFQEISDPSVDVKVGNFVVFSKKNANDLRKLINKVGNVKDIIIVDDEADYASPNAKVNRGEQTKINELVSKLLGPSGTYIGVTATPARLDLNNTFKNDSSLWVKFPAHPLYTGQDQFFPIDIADFKEDGLKYQLTRLKNTGDDPRFERSAFFRFLVNVAHLNIASNDVEQNYSFLIHTSGKKIDHKKDLKTIREAFATLSDQGRTRYERYVKEIWTIAKDRYPDVNPNVITKYILQNINRKATVILNSEPDFKKFGGNATNPSALFTVVIGGNIVSRGVTFNNLLSMFFTRDVKHKMQQDTYIQRARMFGSRGEYLSHFELTIPETLYADWHRCFVYHRLSLASIESDKGSPAWLADSRIAAVAGTSIDRSTVDMNMGEMSFALFKYTSTIDDIIDASVPTVQKLENLASALGDDSFPTYLKEYILRNPIGSQKSVLIYPTGGVFPGMTPAEKKAITRRQGFLTIRQADRVTGALHFLRIFKNDEGNARLFYKFDGSIQFLQNMK
jgi:hypothetical protein